MGGGIFTSPLIIVIFIARITAYSSIDFAAIADSSVSSLAQHGPKSSLPSQQPHLIVKRSFVVPADPAAIEKKSPHLSTLTQFVNGAHLLHEKTEPHFKATRLAAFTR